MPELPDVEAVRQYLLSKGLVGLAITGVELFWPRAIRVPSEQEFKSELPGRRIRAILRRGKYLILRLDGRPGRTLILHLRMTGSLLVHAADRQRPRHTRNLLVLDDGLELCFVDPRKLGAIWLVKNEAEVLAKLGPEPLDPAFTPEVLAEQLSGRNVPVKALLCDQAVVAGIGNIYADEVLFASDVHPTRRGRDTSPEDVGRLHAAIVTTLTEALHSLAVPVESRASPAESARGGELFRMPRSEGVPCTKCGSPIRRIMVRGRSSYFCSRCQGG